MTSLLLAALLALPAGGTWTVDDDGPADFPDIASAVQAVPAGDTLLVQPGTYGPFTLGKRLAILGPAAGPLPVVTGRSQVAGVSRAELGGLALASLTLWSVPGPVVIDGCTLGPLDPPDEEAALEVVACAQVLVSRSTLAGAQAVDPADIAGQAGLRVIGSRVSVVDSLLSGGAGRDGDFAGPTDGGNGGSAVVVRGGSEVLLAGCPSITGGRAGECVGFVCDDGAAGDGVAVLEDSLLVLRGASADTLDAGSCWCGPPFGGQHGYALRALDGTSVLSGVAVGTLQPLGVLADPGAVVVQPSVAEPFTELDGGLAAGDALALRLHGPAGSSALLAASTGLGLQALGGFEGSLWLGPAGLVAVVPLVLAGQDTPLVLPAQLPPTAGLEGLLLAVQVAHPGVPGALAPGKSLLGNPVPLLVRF